MKRFAVAAITGAVFLSPAALAQTAAPSPPSDLTLKPLGGLAPVPPALGPIQEGRGPRMLGMREMRDPPPPPSSRGAQFSFSRGPLEVLIRCGENDGVKPCSDAALALMDKFTSMSSALPEAAPPSGDAPIPTPSPQP